MPRAVRKPFKSQRAQNVQPPQPARLIEAPQSAAGARIAEWNDVPAPARRAKAKPVVASAAASKSAAAPVAELKDAKRKPSVRKPVAKPAAKKPAGRTKKAGSVGDANITVGSPVEAPTEAIGAAANAPKVSTDKVPTDA